MLCIVVYSKLSCMNSVLFPDIVWWCIICVVIHGLVFSLVWYGVLSSVMFCSVLLCYAV